MTRTANNKNFSLGKPSFSYVVPLLQKDTVMRYLSGLHGYILFYHPQFITHHRTFPDRSISTPNLRWANLDRLFDQAVSKRTGI